MAEVYLKKLAADRFEAESAGLEPGKINPLVAEVMKEEGIDITKNSTNDVFEFFRQGRRYDCIVTVCSREAADRCPVFPVTGQGAGQIRRLHWPFDDPSQVTGTHEQKLEKIREIRDQIKQKIQEFIRDSQSG
jgi:arsenate reductase